MSLVSRILRTLVAASTLHLMLAVPVRACPADAAMAAAQQTADAPSDAAPMPMHHMHGGAAMPTTDATPSTTSSAPVPDNSTPCQHQMPCCPPASTGCAAGACTITAPVALIADAPLFDAPLAAVMPGTAVTVGVSFLHAPEPPPPRA